jgi:predicted dehydrogenase
MTQTYHQVGIIGFGDRGQDLANTLIFGIPEYCRVAAVAEKRKNPAVTPQFSFHCADVPFFTDYHDLLAMKEIDSVIVATYEDTHVQIVKDAIEAGKAVYCEKPIVPDLASAEELYRFVTSRPCQFQIGLNLPNYPVARKLKELLDAHVVGDLTMVRSDCDVGQTFARTYHINKFSGKRGNFVTAKLTHDTDLLQYLAGSYAEVVWGKTANFQWRRHGMPPASDDTAVMAGILHSGAFFTQTLTSCGATYGRRMHFFGKDGEISAEIGGLEIRLVHADGREETIPVYAQQKGGHMGADRLTTAAFFDYVDSGVMKPRWPERILSSVMIPMAALTGGVVQTGAWYRSVVEGAGKGDGK